MPEERVDLVVGKKRRKLFEQRSRPGLWKRVHGVSDYPKNHTASATNQPINFLGGNQPTKITSAEFRNTLFQGFHSFCSLTQGGARFTSLALGYRLRGFQPFWF